MLKIAIPGSKSYTNRALIMAALTKGPVYLHNPLYSDDTEAMIECLRTLGLTIDKAPGLMIVQDDISSIKEGNFDLFARDSGTTVRFILALLCVVPGIKTLRGSPRLSERPIQDLIDALRLLGAHIEFLGKEGELPVKISSSTLTGCSIDLKSDLSSQFCSSLLLIAPALRETLTIRAQGIPISKSYIDMTVSCMRDWGVLASWHTEIDPRIGFEAASVYTINGGQKYLTQQALIEGDFSSASYFFALSALAKSKILVENLNPHSAQPDRKFLGVLEKMGSSICYRENAIKIEGAGVRPLNVDMEDCPDQVMTLAVLAAFADGITQISGVRSLRVKESNRVFALRNELAKMGISTIETHNTLTIYGGLPHEATIATYNDHRIAMAFAIAKLRLPNLTIEKPEVVGKTFPTFWELFERCL